MRYLDENIYCSTTSLVSVNKNATTPYTVYQCPLDLDEGTAIFVGNYFSTVANAKVIIRLNDYIKCYHNVGYNALIDQYTTDNGLVSYDDEPPIMKYYFVINGVKSEEIVVCRGFRYPNRLKQLEQVNNSPDKQKMSINLQGETVDIGTDTQDFFFKPHFPYKSGLDVFLHIDLTMYYSNDKYLTSLVSSDGNITFKTMNEDINLCTFIYRLSCNKDNYGKELTKDTTLTFRGTDDGENIVVYDSFGVFDYCPAKYYLVWMDRLGGTQCQGFDGTSTFSMEYERNTYTKYNGEKYVYNTKVQSPTFRINSGWLKDEVVPFYESIYVSPYLHLIDVENNKVYNVIIKDTSFTEKTFNNQGNNLFNLSFELEINKNQQLVW